MKIELHKQLNSSTFPVDLECKLEIPKGQIVAIQGESGAGKSSLLRMIAGLLKPDSGRLEIEDKTWFSSEEKINVPAHQRDVGLVFQDYALFPNMSVRKNLEYALPKGTGSSSVDEWLMKFRLEDVSNRLPQLLSGGQQQRAALARTLANKSRILLLDEPFSAIDVSLRREIQEHLLSFQKEVNATIVLVTHDSAEIHRMCDRVLTMEAGKIIADIDVNELRDIPLEGHLTMSGEIMEISDLAEERRIKVLVDNKVVLLKFSLDEHSALKVGDRIQLNAEVSGSSFKKLEY